MMLILQDIIPCIRCNRCHGLHRNGPWLTVCSVNPRVGIEHRIDKLISTPNNRKRVAIIGGGSAGMEAAITACGRGHEVVFVCNQSSGLYSVTAFKYFSGSPFRMRSA